MEITTLEQQLQPDQPFAESPKVNSPGHPKNIANEQAAQGSYILGDNLLGDFEQITTDLQQKGVSQKLQLIKEGIKQEQRDTSAEAFKQAISDPTLSPEQRQALVQSTFDVTLDNTSIPVWQEFRKHLGTADTNEGDPEYDSMRDTSYLDEVAPVDGQKLTDIASQIAVGNSSGTWLDGLSGFGELSIPFNHEDDILDLRTVVMGVKPGIIDRVSAGEALHDMRKHLETLSPDELVDTAKRVGEFFKNRKGIFKDTAGFQAFITIQELFAGTDNHDRLLENVFNIMDIVGVGSLAKGAVNKLTNSALVSATAPRTADRIFASVLKDPIDRAGAELNLNKGDIVFNSMYPAPHDAKGVTLVPADVMESVNRIDREVDDILKTQIIDNPTVARVVADKVNNLFGGRIHINKTTTKIAKDGQSVNMKVTVGRTSDSGFRGINGAKMAARMRGLDPETEIKLFRRSPTTGKIVPIKKGQKTVKDGTEVYYQFSKDEPISMPNVLEQADINLTDVNTRLFKIRTIAKGKSISRSFKDIRTIFNKDSADRLARIPDRENNTKRLVANLLRTFDSLKTPASKEKVFTYLTEGSIQKREFTEAEALTGNFGSLPPMSRDEFIAYKEVRAANKLNYLSKNLELKTDLENSLAKSLRVTTTEKGYTLFGRPLKESESLKSIKSIKTAVDPETGKLTTVTAEDIAAAQHGKTKLFKLTSKERFGNDTVDFAILRGDKNFQRIEPLPERVLPEIEGYLYRRHKDKFFITKTDNLTTINGKKIPSASQKPTVVNTANSEKRAEAYIDNLNASRSEQEIADGVRYEFRFSRENIEANDLGSGAYDYAKNTGLLHQGRRGNVISSIEPEQLNLASVAEGITRGINQTAKVISRGAIIRSLKERFMKDFDQVIAHNSNNVKIFPIKNESILPGKTTKEVNLSDRAKAVHETITSMERFDDPLSKGWSQKMFELGNYLDSKDNALARAIKSTGRGIGGLTGLNKRDPLDALRSFTFAATIGLNPLRQGPLQLAQHIVLTPLAPKYILSGQVYRDTKALMMGAARRGTKDWERWSKIGAKKMKMGVKEYTDFVDGWINSGLNQISGHSFLKNISETEELAGLRGAERAGTKVRQIVGAPAKTFTHIGFAKGEIGNLALTYNISRKLLKDEGKALTMDAIAGRARSLSFTMNNAGEFRYQTGALKALTQFWSFQHKGFLTMLPESLGGVRDLSLAQKGAIGGVQIALLGTEGLAGLGIYKLVDEMFNQYEDATDSNVPPVVDELVKYGTVSFALNSFLRTAFDDQNTSINFSEVGPLSGTNFLNGTVLDTLISTNENIVQKMFGASGTFMGKFARELQLGWAVYNLPDPEHEVENTLLALKHVGTGISSQLSNYTKGQIALNTGFFTDKHNNKVVRATATEAVAKMAFGLNSQRLKEFYELSLDSKGVEQARKADAKLVANAIIDVATANNDQPLDVLTSKVKVLTSYLSLLPEDERQVQRLSIAQELRDTSKRSSKARSLMIRILESKTYDADVLKRKIAPFLPNPEERDVMNKLIDTMYAKPTITIDR